MPYGWRLVGGAGKQLEPDPAEQVVVELAREKWRMALPCARPLSGRQATLSAGDAARAGGAVDPRTTSCTPSWIDIAGASGRSSRCSSRRAA